ncbi:hypothetical protein QYM36_010969 [Artemia franciscana]|uniref:PiggyBac transposable element-derived protein domain-containing protein n=1 Tax=Artemia franciscana TaxID=6661 RepID=A0AA88HQM4_ARTSF|nr:hypothetical protein QYM36_010969 [Artemia franciscana]
MADLPDNSKGKVLEAEKNFKVTLDQAIGLLDDTDLSDLDLEDSCDDGDEWRPFNCGGNLRARATDRLWSVRPLLEEIRKMCIFFERGEFMSIDEQMIPFFGRSSMKQFVPNKPNSLCLKNFMLADSSGLVYDFIIYLEKTTFLEHLQVKGLGSACVLHLIKGMKEETSLFFGRFFTSIKFLQDIDPLKIKEEGTLMKNHLEGAPVKSKGELKRLGRGTSVSFVREDRKTALAQWYDNKTSFLASDSVAKLPEENVRRYDKKQKKYTDVQCPRIIRDYNQHIGGCRYMRQNDQLVPV